MTYLPDTRRQLVEAAERRTGDARGPRLLPWARPERLYRLMRPARLGWVAPAVSLIVAAAVAIAFLGLGSGSPASRPTTAGGHAAFQIVFRAEPTPQVPVVTRAALARTVRELRGRLAEIAHSRASIHILGGSRIQVEIVSPIARTRLGQEAVARRLDFSAQLEFYDWESNVLLPNGQTAASELHPARPDALALSQGEPGGSPGNASLGSGSLELYQAVLLASRQPYAPSSDNSRLGSEYYLFARAGSRACALADRTLAAEFGRSGSGLRHCLVAGPLDPGEGATRRQAVRELEAGLPAAADRHGQLLVVKQGTIVVEAPPVLSLPDEPFGNPAGGYYVLHDHVALSGNEITDAQASTAAGGVPDVQFSFTPQGAAAFQRLTAAEARRGELVSTSSQTLDQHFAVALDNRLIVVSAVDFRDYPKGLTAGTSVHLTGRIFTGSAARGVARALQLEALPVKLVPLS